MSVNIYSFPEFQDMDSAYWGLGFTNKELLIGLCTHDPSKSATVLSFNPGTKSIKKLFSLSEIVKPKRGSQSQGKIHTPLFQGTDGNMYFGTHFAYPFGKPQSTSYEGGHLISLNPHTFSTKDLGIPIVNEGILTLVLDSENMILYGLSAPSFIFFSYDIGAKKYKNHGQVTNKGSICRSLVVDDDGDVYGSFEENQIFKFNRTSSKIEYLKTKLPGSKTEIKEWKGEYRGGVNYIGRKIWRSVLWHRESKKIYGIHAEESNLFSLDPRENIVKTITPFVDAQFTNSPDKIYPTLSLSNYINRLYYVPVDGFFDYCRSENMVGCPPIMSYDILNKRKINHGAIRDLKRNVIGVAGSTMSSSGVLYLIGAVEVLKGEEYNSFNVINGKGFRLGLIEIDTNKLSYE